MQKEAKSHTFSTFDHLLDSCANFCEMLFQKSERNQLSNIVRLSETLETGKFNSVKNYLRLSYFQRKHFFDPVVIRSIYQLKLKSVLISYLIEFRSV